MLRKHRLGYPPSALAVISQTTFIVGGGGGKSKTGIPNRVTMMGLENDKLKELSHIDFGEDRVVGVCEVAAHQVVFCSTAQGKTHEVSYKDNKLTLVSTTATADVLQGEDTSPSQRAMAANPAGDRLLISQGSTINVWKYSKGDQKPLKKLKNIVTEDIHSDDVRDVAFAPKGDVFITLDDGMLGVWDVSQGKLICKARPSAAVTNADSQCASTSPAKLKFRGAFLSDDGRVLYTAASGSKGGYIASRQLKERGEDASGGWAESTIKDRMVTADPITCVSSARGARFALGTAEGEVAIVDQNSLRCLCKLEAHGMPITKVALLSSGNTFSLAFDNTCALALTKEHMKQKKRQTICLYVLVFVIVFLIMFYVLGIHVFRHDIASEYTPTAGGIS